MTLEEFNTLVAAPGDTNALRAELAVFPFWKVAKCSTTFKLPDGRVFTEESVATTKTVGGKFIVWSMESQYLKQSLRAVIAYDEKASAIKSWGIAGGALAVGTVVLDPEKRLVASSCAHGEFLEISVGSYSVTESFSRTSVYKNGVLSLMRDASYRPMKAEAGSVVNDTPQIR
jgi:hypothetical protein